MTILKLQNISYAFPNGNRNILNNINYQIRENDFIVLLGGNGSGKSTLLKFISRHKHHHTDMPITLLTQNVNDSLFNSLSIFENYLLYNKIKKENERKFLASYLMDYNPNLADKLDATIDTLSGGEKQALTLALCLLQPPKLLLLDEHTSALDPKTSKQIMELTFAMVKKHNITCIMTTHDLDIAMEFGNRILVLRNGKVHQTIDESEKILITKDKLLRIYN